MIAVASPIIEEEMKDWTALGGQNFGILGAYDGTHPTGFHRAGFEVPTSDYSRSHDPGTPYNMAWACAGDFAHVGKANLRALHAGLLARLMADDPALKMIVEFIGQPWADQPVMYWARWNGVKTLKRYTGAGHDRWSHISWQRSTANQRAYLWRPQNTVNGDDMANTWTEPLTQGTPGYAGQQRDTALAFTWKASNEAAQGVTRLLAAAEADKVRDEAALAAIKGIAAVTGADMTPVVDAVNAVRDEAREKFAALMTATAAAEQRAAEAEAEVAQLRDQLAAAGAGLAAQRGAPTSGA